MLNKFLGDTVRPEGKLNFAQGLVVVGIRSWGVATGIATNHRRTVPFGGITNKLYALFGVT